MEAAEGLKLPIIRRYSGGGTVYHDLGNALYSFITPRSLFSRTRFVEALAQSLRQHGLNGIRVNGRHDLVLEDTTGVRKVGGSAFRIVRERAYHHGTLLLSSDLARLKELLRSPLKIEGAAVSSVVSPVANVPMSHELFSQLASQAFISTLETPIDIDVIDVDERDAEGNQEVERAIAELSSCEWTFQRGPSFKVQVGSVQCSVVDGRIAECSDERLAGHPFHPRLLRYNHT